MRRAPSTLVLLAWAAVLLAGPVHASSNYPTEIEKQLGLSYTPNCAICHANGITGYGTVTTAFGMEMRARGLVCCNVASLDSALAALEGENSPYITDLKEGLDPNNPNAGTVVQPSYGCFNVTGGGLLPGGSGVLLLLLALLYALRPRSVRR